MSQVKIVDNMPPPPVKYQESRYYILCMNVLNTATHLTLGALAVGAAIAVLVMDIPQSTPVTPSPFPDIFPKPKTNIAEAHIYLSVYGYIILMLQTILSFNPSTEWAENMMYPQKRIVHLLMQICGSVLAMAGCIIGFDDGSNLFTTHGSMGIFAFILTTISLVGAIFHLLCASTMNSKSLKTLQVYAVIVTLVAAFISLSFGFDLLKVKGYAILDHFIAISVLALVGMLVMTVAHVYKRGNNFVI